MQRDANLVELEKCCQTHIFLQNFVLIQPRTRPPKFCKILLILSPASPPLPASPAWPSRERPARAPPARCLGPPAARGPSGAPGPPRPRLLARTTHDPTKSGVAFQPACLLAFAHSREGDQTSRASRSTRLAQRTAGTKRTT